MVNRKQFEQFITKSRPKALSLGMRLFANNKDDAEDLVQVAFMKAHRFFDQCEFENENNLRSWYIAIIMNTFKTEYTKRKKTPPMWSLDKTVQKDHGRDHMKMHEIIPDERIDPLLYEKVEKCKLALENIPEYFRKPFVMFNYDGYSYKEICDVLHLPIGTVKSQIARAKQIALKVWGLDNV